MRLRLGNDEVYARWLDHLAGIVNEVYTMHMYRFLWRRLAEITQSADLPPSVIFDAFGVWYASTQAAAVRRQVDRRRDVVSLVRLLEEIAAHPEVMTRDRHLALWRRDDGDFEEPGNRNYDRFAGARERDVVETTLVRGHIQTLTETAEVVRTYVNEVVAHTADETTHAVPTFAELNAAIDTIGEIVKEYASLLKAEVLWQLEPVIQHDWEAPFRQRWITEDE